MKSPKYAPTINWLENERKVNLKGYYDGGHTHNVQSVCGLIFRFYTMIVFYKSVN